MRRIYPIVILTISLLFAACGGTGGSAGFTVRMEKDKDTPFDAKTAHADMRPDLTEVHFALGNYEFSMKPKTVNSIEALKADGHVRITFGLKGTKGEDFNNPVQPGDYENEKVEWMDIYYFKDGAQQISNVENIKGKVTISSVTDTEIAGTIDVTGDGDKMVKGSFKAKKVK